MCLGIPGKILEISDEDGLKMAKVDYSGIVNNICLNNCEDAKVGQYVIDHAGFALSVLDEDVAKETLGYYQQMAEAAAKVGKDILDNPLGPNK